LDKAWLLAHSKTLRTVVLGTGASGVTSYYSVQDMRDILEKCQKLDCAAINLPPAHLGIARDLASQFKLGPDQSDPLHATTELEAMLVSFQGTQS